MTSDDTNQNASPAASEAPRQRPRRRATRTFGTQADAVTVPQGAGGSGNPFEITLPQPASERAATTPPAASQPAAATLDVFAELAPRETAAPAATRSRRASRPTAAPEVAVEVPDRVEAPATADSGQGATDGAAPKAAGRRASTKKAPAKKAPAKAAVTAPDEAITPAVADSAPATADAASEGAPATKAPARRSAAKKAPATKTSEKDVAEPAAAEAPTATTPRKAPARRASAPTSPDAGPSDATPAQPPRLATTALLFQAPDPTTAPRRHRRAQAPAGAPHAADQGVQVPTFASVSRPRKDSAESNDSARSDDSGRTNDSRRSNDSARSNDSGRSKASESSREPVAQPETSVATAPAAPAATTAPAASSDEQPRARRGGRKRASRPAGSASVTSDRASASSGSASSGSASSDTASAHAGQVAQDAADAASATATAAPVTSAPAPAAPAPAAHAFAVGQLAGDDRLAIDEVELIERELLDEGVENELPEFDAADFADDESGAVDGTQDAARAEADADDDAEDADAEGSSAGGQRRRRRRGGRGRRRSTGGGDADRSDDGMRESAPADDASGTQDTDDRTDQDAPAVRAEGRDETRSAGRAQDDGTQDDSSQEQDDQDGDTEGSGSSRRRRRRRRGGAVTETTTVRAARATDEVTALKGSTRLEAKRQRRREGRDAGRRRQTITEAEFLARRESVQRSMIVREKAGRTQIAVLEDGVLVEHYVSQQAQASMVGNVYLGRVQNVLPSMEAAFVDIGKGRNAVLYAGEVNWDAAGVDGQPRRIEQALKSGDPILVQVTKDPIGHKGARLTSQVTLAGRYLVFVPGGGMTGISRKLPDTERNRLKKILREVVPEGAGVIVRTAAEGASEDELRADVDRLTSQWEAIDAKSKKLSAAPVLLQGEPDLAIRVVRDIFNDDFGSLVVSGEGAWVEISSYLSELAPDLASRASKWVGGVGGADVDVFAEHRIDEQLAKGMDRKVWLPSGGSLVIDRTEAMTVVDVNTGKFTGSGGTLEETVTRNNLEAAEEIVRQLRLRDIGGIIVIDFIDMVLESNRDLVLRRLVECLGRDRTKHQVAEVTSLGLVQMTRKRVGQGLVEAFSETCSACNGRGFIVHDDPIERGGNHQHGASEQSDDDQGDARRSSSTSASRRRRSKSESSTTGSGHAQSVPVLPESRDAVKATLATIAAAAAHAHEHDHELELERAAMAQDAVLDLVLEGRVGGAADESAQEVTSEPEQAEAAPEPVADVVDAPADAPAGADDAPTDGAES